MTRGCAGYVRQQLEEVQHMGVCMGGGGVFYS